MDHDMRKRARDPGAAPLSRRRDLQRLRGGHDLPTVFPASRLPDRFNENPPRPGAVRWWVQDGKGGGWLVWALPDWDGEAYSAGVYKGPDSLGVVRFVGHDPRGGY